MKLRAWVILGGPEAAHMLPTTAALIGPTFSPKIPDAAQVEPGRWIIWQEIGTTLPPLTLVCIELPM